MSLTIETEGATTLLCRRHFGLTPERVFAAHTEPDLLRRWLTGPEGWTMSVCDSDPRPGGQGRFVWERDNERLAMTMVFEALEPPHRIIHREDWEATPETARAWIETLFEPDGTGTAMTMRMVYPSSEARDEALASGMADGMEESYARIDALC
ncbi:MAG: SRPBCC domain-containing protein [Paracoccaceae bacterium]|nr:SRPBCC domain-containing protein [Paracoccaceae bacterium]